MHHSRNKQTQVNEYLYHMYDCMVLKKRKQCSNMEYEYGSTWFLIQMRMNECMCAYICVFVR